MFEFDITGVNIPISDVGGLSDIETAVNYNEEMGVYSLSSPKTITIVGTGFKNLFEDFINSFESKYTINIYKIANDLRYTLFSGEIYLSDIVFEPKFAKATITLINKGFQNKIDSNFSVPVSMSAEQSKSSKVGAEIFITPPTLVDFGTFQFWTAPGVSISHNAGGTVEGYDLIDCFEHIVNYVSDGEVTFASTWYDNIGNENHIAVLTGEEFRTGGGNAPILNFKDLFLTCKKLFNLVFLFEQNPDGTKNMRIEKQSYLEENGGVLTITDTIGLSVQIDQSKLYNSIRVGSTEAYATNGEIVSAGLQFPKIQGGAFSVEEFAVQSDSTTDNQLDLTVDIVYDHNVLEDIAVNSNTDYDDKILFIQYTATSQNPTTGDALGVASLSDASYFFNQMFLNNAILKRQSIYAPLVLHISDSSDTYLAINGITSETYSDTYQFIDTTPVVGSYNVSAFNSPIRYINDYTSITYADGTVLTGFDANNNFGNGTAQGTNVSSYSNSKFIAPNDGVYAFDVKTKVRINYFKNNLGIVRQKIIVTNSVGTVKYTYTAEYASRQRNTSTGWQNYFNANGNGYLDKTLLYVPDYAYGAWGGVEFTIIQNEIVYLDQDDRVYVEIECEERAGGTIGISGAEGSWQTIDDTRYPSEETNPLDRFDVGTTGNQWQGGSGTNYIIKPIYFGCSKNTEALNIHIETEKPFGLYQLSFDGHLTEEQVQDVLSNSNTNVNISSGEILCFGVVKNLSIKHKSNLCKFVVGSRKINKNGA